MQVPKTPQNGGMWSFKDRCALLFKVGSNRSNYAKIKMEVSPDQDTLGFFTPDDLHLLEVVLDLVLRRELNFTGRSQSGPHSQIADFRLSAGGER